VSRRALSRYNLAELDLVALNGIHMRMARDMQPARLAVADLPTDDSIRLAICTDETGGATLVFFDGTNWRRVQDRAVAS
jgi:hypothetical protein